MNIFDIFLSLQGEGTRAGEPMWFVRLAGCDLACTYCDTVAARQVQAGRDMSVEEVLAAVASPALPWLMVTGGEPMLQVTAVNGLIDALEARGRHVLVETSGAHPLGPLDPRAVRIVDVKTPGSGMAGRMAWANLDALRPQDEVKFVLTGREDYEWACKVLRRHSLADRATVLFSAAAPSLAPETLARWILDDALPVRLNLQIHKILNLP
jgi:7-carboxy-7-deazaguanine synthase